MQVRGRNFGSGETVDIYEDSYIFYTATADEHGSFGPLTIQIRTFFGPVKLRIRAVGETSGLAAQVYFRIHTNWSQFHFTPDRASDNEFENVISPRNVDAMQLLWTGVTSGDTSSFSGTSQVDGTIYVASNQGHTGYLEAFGETGCGAPVMCHPVWSASTVALYGTPAVAGGSVFIGGEDAALHVFDAGSGTPLWTGSVGSGIVQSSPLVADGSVFVGSTFGNVFAFPEAGCGQPTCQPSWTGTIPEAVTGSPASAGGLLFVGSQAAVYAFDAGGCGQASCAPLWSASVGFVFGSPAVADGVVYVGTETPGDLFAIDALTGAVLWTGGTSPDGSSSPAVARDTVYVGGADGVLYAFAAAGCGGPTCTAQWTGQGSGQMDGFGPAVANGLVIAPASDDLTYAFPATCDQSSCDPLMTFDTPYAISPTITDGYLFSNGTGGVRAFGLPGLDR